jgi:uncharacterized protein YjbI with pentapeptide repeats
VKKILKFVKDKTMFLTAIALATMVGGISTAVVMAAIPDNSGVLHACYRNSAGLLDPKGSVRIIDDASESCTGQETAITWDQFNDAPGTRFGEMLSLTGKPANEMNLSHLNLSNQDFTGTNFDSSVLSYSDFTNSNFTNATLDSRPAQFANFTGATFTNANIDYEFMMDDSNFTNANMAGVTVRFSASNSNFSGTNLSNAVFNSAYLVGSNMSSANLSGATWTNTMCPDGTNSNSNGNTCIGHLTP